MLFVTGEYPPRIGGVGDHVARLRPALEALGAATFVATESVPHDDPGAGVYATAARPWGRQLYGVQRLVRSLRPDVVHVQYQAGAFASPGQISWLPLALAGLRFQGALAVTFHDLVDPYLFPKAGVLRRLATDVLRRRAAVSIYVDAHDRAHVCSRIPGQWRKCRVIPAGPTVEPPDDLADRTKLRADLGFDASEFLVGYFGFRQRGKGLDTLALALRAAELRPYRPRLVLIGAAMPNVGAQRADVPIAAADLAGLDVIESGALGPRELSAWISCCDVMALPYRDGLSTRRGTFMVAVAHGIPVVTTSPPRPELLDVRPDEVIFVPPGDAALLAGALARVRSDEAGRRQLASGAQAVAQRYSWRRIARQTLDAYGR